MIGFWASCSWNIFQRAKELGEDILLCRQHSCVGRTLITVRFDLHTAGDSNDGLAATGITQNVSLCTIVPNVVFVVIGLRKIGDMDEGIVEAGKDTCDTYMVLEVSIALDSLYNIQNMSPKLHCLYT